MGGAIDKGAALFGDIMLYVEEDGPVRLLRTVAVLLATLAWGSSAAAQTLPVPLFERYLDSLRQQAGIPGLSAAIVHEGRIVWEQGFGQSDVENAIAAHPSTPYPISDLTSTVSAALLGQCADRGLVEFDAPLRNWTTQLPEADATLRHVAAHASAAPPGSSFKYAPQRYATLATVIEACNGLKPFRKVLADEVLDRLGMADSVPGRDLADSLNPAREPFEPEELARYAPVLARLAVPYRVDKSGKASRSDYPPAGVDAAVGLISTVRDLARLDAALDDGILLDAEVRELMWTNVLATSGAPLPTGLGWFVQGYNGERVVWHFGSAANAFSSLVVKVPARRLTLLLLANSDGLGASLADGDVTASPFARLFLRMFL